jgi:hypothetical protein
MCVADRIVGARPYPCIEAPTQLGTFEGRVWTAPTATIWPHSGAIRADPELEL